MRVLLVAFIMILISSKIVWSQDIFKQFEIISPPSCINNNGINVQFQNLSSKLGEFSAGVAKRNKKSGPIVYRLNYEKSP